MSIFYILGGVLYLFVVIFAIYSAIAVKSAAPWVPTFRKRVDGMLALAGIQPSDTVLDLGSGDGRMVEEAAKRGAALSIGVEMNPTLYWISKMRARLKQLPAVEYVRTDLWHYDCSKADVVLLFFIQSKMARLEEKLQRELKPGTRVVSHIFRFPTWQYTKKDGMLYLYIV